MLAPPHVRPSADQDVAAVLVELLQPGTWIAPAQARWLPVIEALLEAFLRHFDVFRFRDRTSEGNAIAFKTVRADSLLRIQNEAAIFMRMAKDCPAVLDPLYSGLPESIFHADPHAGNLMVQTQKHAPPTLVLLDWSQASPALCTAAPRAHRTLSYCVTG